MRNAFLLILLCAALVAVAADTGWQLPAWRYRVPVQVYNTSGLPVSAQLLAVRDLPFTALISEGKVARDGRDLRLLNSKGNELPIRAEALDSDEDAARVCFFLHDIDAHGKARLWLYYGNDKAEAGTALGADEKVPLRKPGLIVTFGAEEAQAPEQTPAPAPGENRLQTFLQDKQLREFEGQTATGFTTIKHPTPLRVSGGACLQADGGTGRTVALEFAARKGPLTCWVRYAPGDDVKTAPVGTLTFTLAQGDKTLATETEQFIVPDDNETVDTLGDAEAAPDTLALADEALLRERTGYRWVPLRAKAANGNVTLTVTVNGLKALLDCAVVTGVARYQPDIRDFVGRVWVRWRVNAPAEFRHTAYVNNQISYDYKGAHWEPSGHVSAFGVAKDEQFPQDEDDALPPGAFSPWVPLAASSYNTWFAQISAKVFNRQPFAGGTAQLEFANRPATSHVFHVTASEPLDLDARLCVRMPTTTTIAGLSELETFHEWALRRLDMLHTLQLGPSPRLTRLRLGAWGNSGNVPQEWADIDFSIFDALGINMASFPNDEIFSRLAPAHGIIDTNTIAWGPVDGFKKARPFSTSISTRFNMGDEPGACIEPKGIEADPAVLAQFRDWLRAQQLTPELLGVTSWDEVFPTEDRRLIGGAKPPPPPMVKQIDIDDPLPTLPNDPEDTAKVFKDVKFDRPGPKPGSVEAGRLFYYSRRFIDVYSAQQWRKATENVLHFFPEARLISPNYQAGPMQSAFLGNNNDPYRGMIDIFLYTRSGALRGVGMEDWVYGWDGGVNNCIFAAEIIRSACRSTKTPMSSLLVGGGGIRARLYGYLMHGLLDNDLYLYGPLVNIGPPWGDDPRAYREIAQASREMKHFEDAIADGALRPRKAALLVAYTSEIMQRRDFCGLRLGTYAGLKHSYTQVDVVNEQEISEDHILDHYGTLFVTDPNATVAVQRTIAEWVQHGGKLWACLGALDTDEFQQYCPILDPVFGVTKRVVAPGKPTTLAADSPLFGGKVTLGTTDRLLDATATTAQVLGAYADGTPAIFLNHYGQGEALLVGALVGQLYWNRHFAKDSIHTPGGTREGGAEAQQLLNAFTTPADRPVRCSLPGIYTTVMDGPQGSLVFLNNATFAGTTPDPKLPAPTVTVHVQPAGPITTAESVKLGKLEFTMTNGEVVFTLPLPDADMVMLKR